MEMNILTVNVDLVLLDYYERYSSFHSWFHLVDSTVNSQELAERDGSEHSHD